MDKFPFPTFLSRIYLFVYFILFLFNVEKYNSTNTAPSPIIDTCLSIGSIIDKRPRQDSNQCQELARMQEKN